MFQTTNQTTLTLSYYILTISPQKGVFSSWILESIKKACSNCQLKMEWPMPLSSLIKRPSSWKDGSSSCSSMDSKLLGAEPTAIDLSKKPAGCWSLGEGNIQIVQKREKLEKSKIISISYIYIHLFTYLFIYLCIYLCCFIFVLFIFYLRLFWYLYVY